MRLVSSIMGRSLVPPGVWLTSECLGHADPEPTSTRVAQTTGAALACRLIGLDLAGDLTRCG